jgi:hypothetical protein
MTPKENQGIGYVSKREKTVFKNQEQLSSLWRGQLFSSLKATLIVGKKSTN